MASIKQITKWVSFMTFLSAVGILVLSPRLAPSIQFFWIRPWTE